MADAFTFFHERYRCAEHRIDLTARHKKRRGAAFFQILEECGFSLSLSSSSNTGRTLALA